MAPRCTTRFAPLLLLVALLAPLPAQHARAAESDAAPRVLIVVAEGYNFNEFDTPHLALKALGYRVDVAGPQRGEIATGNKGRPNATANLALDEVNVDDYLALVIPGGHSPAKLAQMPEAIRISKAFMAKDKPVGAICHGPLLLMKADLLRDRVTTALYSVKNEEPDLWTQRAFGRYLDEPFIEDGNLLTGRHVADVEQFTRALADKLARSGGIALPPQGARVLVVHSELDGHSKWAMSNLLGRLGVQVTLLGLDNEAEVFRAATDEADAVVIAVAKDTRLQPIMKAIEAGARSGSQHVLHTLGDDLGATLQNIVNAARTIKPRAKADADADAAAEPFTAAIAVLPGFDDRVVAGAASLLEFQGYRVQVVGPKVGWITGTNGMPVKIDATWDDAKLAKDALIIAPGGVWPVEETVSKAYIDWLSTKHDQGATLMAFGFDSLALGKLERFKGKSFATSGQNVWAFGKQAGKFSRNPVEATDERLITASGGSEVAAAFKLLKQP